jgi:protein gp37
MNDDYAAGYLMGMTDGDGTWRPGQRSDKLDYPQCYWRVALADEEALLATQSHLFAFGLTAEIKPFHVNNGREYYKPMQRLEIRSIPVLTVLDNILNYRETADYGSGYLAGIFDAEGSFNRANLRISNKNQSYIDRVIEYGKLLNLDFRAESPRPNGVINARLYGNRRDRIAFFTLTQPAIRRKTEALFDTSIDTEPATVVRLESLGERELIDIETTTHTFFANGLTTHNCYAEALTKRFHTNFPNGFTLTLHPERLEEPKRWRKPSRIFVNSMSDLFHEDVSIDFLQQVFKVMGETPWHIYQILTKRHERLLELAPQLQWHDNIWMGVSVENQNYVHRVDFLRKVNAKVRFLSCEPLLGPLELNLTDIDWVIVGGESGVKHRPMEIEWAQSIRDRCQNAGVAFFFKQIGGRTPKANGRLLDDRIWDEMPEVWEKHRQRWKNSPVQSRKKLLESFKLKALVEK